MSALLRVRASSMAAVALTLLLPSAATLAGGTAEKALLIIDPTDPDSMYVGNYYKNARNIPDSNVLYMRSAASSYGAFQTTVQAGFLGSLAQRNILDHIDYVVLAPLNSFAMTAPASGDLANSQKISITAAYEIIPVPATSGANPPNNPYGWGATSSYPSQDPAVAFYSQQTYLNGVPSTASGAGSLYMGALLGYTQGPVGNSVPELLAMIDRAVQADGSRPAGTFYFMNNPADVERNARACGIPYCSTTAPIYTNTTLELQGLGGSAVVDNGTLPPAGTSNILGIMSGFDLADILGQQLTFAPGAFADHLTSWAGVLDGSEYQTTVQKWISAGATASAGAVVEPLPEVVKFPSPDLHYYYYQGMSLGESYLHSVLQDPVQMLFYGDPLTRAFAYIPSVNVTAPSGAQSGIITLTPTATTSKPGAGIASFDLLVDGVKTGASISPGQSFSLNTQKLNDGRHDLRVLAYDNTPIQTAGRWIGTLDTANYGHASTLSVSPASGSLVQPFSFAWSATGGGVLEVHLVQNGRVLASSTAASGTLSVYGQNLGAGTSTVKLETWYNDGRVGWSVPVTVNVSSTGTPTGITPTAYSYSKYLTTPSAYVVELPASYDVAPGSATYTVLNAPTSATVIQANAGGPYLIVQPTPGAIGSETLQFSVSDSGGTSNTATVTLVYTSVNTIAVPALSRTCCWNGSQQVGVQFISPIDRAGTWDDTAGSSFSDLTPAGASSSFAYAASGGQIVGEIVSNSVLRGGYWDTTTNPISWVDLTPSGATSAVVVGDFVQFSNQEQVGYGYFPAYKNQRALLWAGTAGSVVDVTPNDSDAALVGTDGGHEVGVVHFDGCDCYHTGFWTGSAQTYVDVNPTGATDSVPFTTDASPPYESVGYATFNGTTHAGIWVSWFALGGPPGTWLDLDPPGSGGSMALGTDANYQVGSVIIGGTRRAALWHGTAQSFVDLSSYLPTTLQLYYSSASSIYHDANGTHILGQAQTTSGDIIAVTWKMP